MKKILIIHNNYRQVGGEDIAVENEIEFLDSVYQVETLIFDNNIQNPLLQFLYFVLNRNLQSERKLQEVLKNFQPDIVYIHNTWFKASISIFRLLEKSNVKVLIKLHNFRYYCTKSWTKKNHLRKKDICEACGFEKYESLFFNKYFQDSFLKSVFMILYGKAYFKILKNNKFKLLVLTDFHRSFLSDLGIDKENIFVYPNYLSHKDEFNEPGENYIIYAGRISKQKGVEELILSFLEADTHSLKLKIVGDGPTLDSLKEKYKNPKIDFLGLRKNSEVIELIKRSKAVVSATKLYEGQPTLLCEASLLGKPSIFPDFGGIPEFFKNDYPFKFEQYNYQELTKKINDIHSSEGLKEIGKENKNYILSVTDRKKLLEKFHHIVYA
tara:strand:- start:469 stop:1614 length:1146 start_codon:yes stop_codon:yes gene_type:complete